MSIFLRLQEIKRKIFFYRKKVLAYRSPCEKKKGVQFFNMKEKKKRGKRR